MDQEQERRRQYQYQFLKDGPNIRGQYWEKEYNKKVVAEMRRDEEQKVKEKLQKQLEDAEEE